MAGLRGAPGGVTVLLGSAISQFDPSGVPTGGAFTAAIGAHLAEGAVTDRDTLLGLLWETAFEHVMERCPEPEVVRRELSAALCATPANDVHRAFARLAEAGVVRHLVTTNYDTGLEAAFKECCPALPLAPVRRRAETRVLGGGEPHVLFKIHGCALPAFARKMAFRLSDEAELPRWKRELLGRLVAGRPLLVAGYSGMDFEICPVLTRMGASRIVWLTFDPLTDNARAVVDEADAVVLQGDVQVLVGQLGAPSSATRSTASADVVERIFAGMDARRLDLWRARIFGEIGCGKEAEAAARRLLDTASSEAERAEALAEHARAIFHLGRYFDAAAEYREAAGAFRRSGSVAALRGALHGLAESSRCAGRFVDAWKAIRAVEDLARNTPDPEQRAEAEVNAAVLRVTLRRHLYQIACALPGSPGAAALREAAARDLRVVAARAAARGGWLFLAQARLWADRYAVPWDRVYTGPMRILDAGKSYGQLGYVTAKMMALRDRLAKGDVPPDAAKEAQRYFDTLYKIGSIPEAWKLAHMIRRVLGPGVLNAEAEKRARDAKRQCQYTPLMRLLQKIAG
ncbi:MAG TPA: SIR2 family protein [Longimicrobium sp.]